MMNRNIWHIYSISRNLYVPALKTGKAETMTSLNFTKNKLNILLLGIIIISSILLVPRLPQISYKISEIINSAMNSKGGKAEVLILFGAPIICLVWCWFVFIKKNYLSALFLQIILFPVTYKAQKVIFINAYEYQIGSDYIQKISLTTFLIIILFCILLFKGLIKRLKAKEWRIFERLILIYAIALTFTQIFNHSFHSTIWLSIGCIWQFVLLFYILSSLCTSLDKIIKLFQALFAFAIVNFLLRVFVEQQVIIQKLGGEIQRVGANAMGPAMSYAGYLAILITICILLYRLKGKILYFGILILLFSELLNTFTRGGSLLLVMLLLIPLWKSERKFFIKHIPALMFMVLFFGKSIWNYISYRGLSIDSNITKLSSVFLRLELISVYFNEMFNFSFLGNGIGNSTTISYHSYDFAPHNIIVEFLDSTGLFVTFMFVALFSYSLTTAFRLSTKLKGINKNISILSVYICIALAQWFLFANTTSTSLLAYYPYEASTIIWVLIFIPFLLKNIIESEQYSSK